MIGGVGVEFLRNLMWTSRTYDSLGLDAMGFSNGGVVFLRSLMWTSHTCDSLRLNAMGFGNGGFFCIYLIRGFR